MIKVSQIQSYWPKIYQMLRNPPQGVNLGSFPSQLPPMNKIQFDQGAHPEEPQAVGYVTTEDTNQDGTLDTIHISSPRLNQELQNAGVNMQMLSQLDNLTPQQLMPILAAFVELISHEAGHLQDFDPNQENPFPGGEGAADAAARSAVQQISFATTNISTRVDKLGSFQMSMEVLNELNKLAAELDELGFDKFSDVAESIMTKYAQTFEEEMGAGEQELARGLEQDRAEKERARKSIALPGYVRLSDPRGKGFYPHFALESYPNFGKIQPKGDPYSYDYLSDADMFVVRTAPEGKHKAVGYRIKPGTAAYEKLAPFKPTPAAPAPAASTKVTDPRAIARELGLKAMPTADNAQMMAESKMALFQSKLDDAAGYIERSVGMITPGGWGTMKGILDVLKNPDASYNQKLEAWTAYKSAAPQLLSEKVARAGDRMIQDAFEQYLDAQKLLELKGALASGAYDMESMANYEHELKKEAELEKPEVPSQKDLEKLFWTGRSAGPFGRD